MYPPTARRAALPLLALAASFAVALPAPAQAGVPTGAESVASITDGLARRLAGTLATPAARSRVTAAVAAAPVDLANLSLGTQFATARTAANHAVQTAKGLPTTADSLLRVRLAHPDMLPALAKGVTPLVAAAPTDDTDGALSAYEPSGAEVKLDTTVVPQRPVLLVEVDVAKALPLGARVVEQTLAARGVGTAQTRSGLNAGYWATKINAVRLSDDEEPWIKGDAEIYSIVSGFGLDGHPKVDIVQQPYLNNDGTTYYPNQLLVHFSAYKYNLADVVMMEDDGDTNYLQLAQAIAAILLTITDQGAYIPLVNAILNAIPTSWWTDDPDYTESWYTLATWSSGRLNGASGNGWMDVSPYWVAPL
ncbi:hypothetical protein F4553_001616 [Allocatelliglobosispora scoriae]|uniref:DUF3103 family protein n=1 Tax=Allocatelliglobosispora scoriae TaxID=643052 RepID=A0A841BGM8_9ACTN|nr:DUF3103 family protein [Allocatelliglobosispora scoriae]MBB5868237.1 hypothetical protein [Allocatelliglobosispora scoriae]